MSTLSAREPRIDHHAPSEADAAGLVEEALERGERGPWLRAPRRFLVVDDGRDARFILARLIRRAQPGAHLVLASDAHEALDAIHEADDGEGLVVVSDEHLGAGPTGPDLLAEVARRHPRATRILLTRTQRESIGDLRTAPHAVLPKDIGLRALIAFLTPERARSWETLP